MRLIGPLLAFALAFGALAQEAQPPYERVLIPIVVNTPIAGAFGSLWQTFFTVRNDADQAVVVESLPEGPCTFCPPVPPHQTIALGITAPDPNSGTFLYVGSPGLGKVTLSLRVQDLSRQALTWGTSIPVVRERNAFTGKLQLLDIPVDNRFRLALRVYDIDPPASRQVRVRVFTNMSSPYYQAPVDSSTPLVDTTVTLTPKFAQGSDRFADQPGTSMIGDLVAAYPQLTSVPPLRPGVEGLDTTPRIRIEMDPMTQGVRFWAFVSVTNNETQHVTVIAPQE
jgi:hypothetical protein